MKKNNPLIEKSYSFSIKIVNLYKQLISNHKEFSLSRQLLKSGTSIGANAEEAQGGQSRKDFAAKIQICYKEARETHYWLRLLSDTNYIDKKVAELLLKDCEELMKILTSILKATRSNQV